MVKIIRQKKSGGGSIGIDKMELTPYLLQDDVTGQIERRLRSDPGRGLPTPVLHNPGPYVVLPEPLT